jgi:hypothetical protein
MSRTPDVRSPIGRDERLTFVLDSPEELDLLGSDTHLLSPDPSTDLLKDRGAEGDASTAGNEEERRMSTEIAVLRDQATVRTVEENRGIGMRS